jgi:hypothetical protein
MSFLEPFEHLMQVEQMLLEHVANHNVAHVMRHDVRPLKDCLLYQPKHCWSIAEAKLHDCELPQP